MTKKIVLDIAKAAEQLQANPELGEAIMGPMMTAMTKENDQLRGAINHALEVDDGLEWLRAWRDGDAVAMADLDTKLASQN